MTGLLHMIPHTPLWVIKRSLPPLLPVTKIICHLDFFVLVVLVVLETVIVL